MSLSKGATFHHSSSSPSEDDPCLSIPHLPRRSPTCSQSTLASWLSEKKDIAQSLADFEQTFSGARGTRSSARRRAAQDFEQQLLVRRASLPTDEGLGSSVSGASERGLAKSFERALDLLSDKDSGLGSSVDSEKDMAVGERRPSEKDGVVKQLIQGWLVRCVVMCGIDVDQVAADADLPESASGRTTRQRGSLPHRTTKPIPTSAVTQSIAPPLARSKTRHPPLSNFARKKIAQHIIDPILREPRFTDLHPLVTSLGSRSNEAVKCLRDLERSLIFEPLVSTLTAYKTGLNSDPHSKTLAISRQLFRTFGEFSVQLVVDTYHQLSESDQRRASDRPYDNGYFLDLVQQVGRLAAQIGTSRQAELSGEAAEDDEMAYSPDDEVTLEGGLGQTGDLAELVRWRHGKGISLRTGQPYEGTAGLKRQHSETTLEEDASRTMARRKKGYIPELVEMKCSDKHCGKIFTRKCDLAKHEKTHSRPFKCPVPNCKYHELGLPTEKERDRHINDKHDPNPHYYKCKFCEFRTKRESNCKQHQEKKHNWNYERAKGKDKAVRTTPGQTPQTPNMEYTPSVHSPAVSNMQWDDVSSVSGSIPGSVQLTPAEPAMPGFDRYNTHPINYTTPLFPRPTHYDHLSSNFGLDGPAFRQSFAHGSNYMAEHHTTPMTPHMMHTPITPAYSTITGQSPFRGHVDIRMDWNNGLPTPESHLQAHSRNPSISAHSPLYLDTSNQVYLRDLAMTHDDGFPTDDFALIPPEASSAFSNAAAASATLFPGMDTMVAPDYDDVFSTDLWNGDDDAYINYDMEGN